MFCNVFAHFLSPNCAKLSSIYPLYKHICYKIPVFKFVFILITCFLENVLILLGKKKISFTLAILSALVTTIGCLLQKIFFRQCTDFIRRNKVLITLSTLFALVITRGCLLQKGS